MKKILLILSISLTALLGAVFVLPVRADVSYGQSLMAERTKLENQLKEIEAQIAQNQKLLVKVQSQKNTLANKIKEMKLKQANLALQIRQASLNVDKTVVQLSQTQFSIDEGERKIAAVQDSLAETIARLARERQASMFNILMTADTFSAFYNQIHNLEDLTGNLEKLLAESKEQAAALEKDRSDLDEQEKTQRDYLTIISLQNASLSENIFDQAALLQKTKGQEANYQTLIKTDKQQIAAIKNRIYNLIGASSQVTFGEAVQIAQWASRQTGVRAAFLLAVLTQESNLGHNVGTCNRAGDPASKSWKVVMKPSRDQQPFLQITSELGLNPNTTPVSCPMKDKNGQQVGWGGAMGPAQFIPSTWLGYRAKITAITGKTANPWDIRDAFLAAGIKLGADGATSKSGEWAAAMRYFSGSTNTAFRFYGDNVVATADKYQADIDKLSE